MAALVIGGVCEFCGKETQYRSPSRVRRFCSHGCSTRATGPSRRKRVTLNCRQCGDSFELTQGVVRARTKAGSSPQFCSTRCMGLAKVDPTCRIEEKCGSCGKNFTHLRGRPRKHCDISCARQAAVRSGAWTSNPDVQARREYFRAYRARNVEKLNAASAKRARQNRPYRNFIQQQRRAAGTLTFDEWCGIIEAAKCCAHCGSTDQLQVDHILAVAKGGKTERGNLQVLCKPCNVSKGTGPSPKRLAKALHPEIKWRIT